MQIAEVIALLLPEETSDPDLGIDTGVHVRARNATALVRDVEGTMRLETVYDDAGDEMLNTGCFRRGKPIIDPMTRQVMGYELEMVACPAWLRAASR